MKVQSAIKLIDTKIVSSNFSTTTLDKKISSELDFTVNFGASRVNEKDNSFLLNFDGILKTDESKDPEKMILKMQFVAVFETSEPVDEEFFESHFARINAPAIAFPFFRNAIAQYLTLAGFDPTYLPSINFSAVENNPENKSGKE